MIDYLQEDFTKNGDTYDVIFSAVGKHSFRRCKRAGEYRAVIDRAYQLEDVIEAHRYVETQQKVGNVLLTIQ